MDESGQPASSVGKALALFRAILADDGRTPAAVLGGFGDIPSSTRHRWITALLNAGLICRVGGGRYLPSIPLVRSLASRTERTLLIDCARPIIRRLARHTGHTAHLGILENEMVTYLIKASGSTANPGAQFTREGGQLEAYCSAIGKVLLSRAPETLRSAYLASAPFPPFTDRTITDPLLIQRELSRVRDLGFAIDDREVAPSLYCLAVPVETTADSSGIAISLSLGSPAKTEAERTNLLESLRSAAREVSDVLG